MKKDLPGRYDVILGSRLIMGGMCEEQILERARIIGIKNYPFE